MTASQKFCKRCLLIQSGKDDILTDIRERIERIPEKEKTADPVYRLRLETCSACDCLENGTCLKCGCYPEFRAAFAKNGCPSGKWNA